MPHFGSGALPAKRGRRLERFVYTAFLRKTSVGARNALVGVHVRPRVGYGYGSNLLPRGAPIYSGQASGKFGRPQIFGDPASTYRSPPRDSASAPASSNPSFPLTSGLRWRACPG